MVEVDNSVLMEAVKSAPEYNAELDRMRLKGESSVRDTLTGEHSTALSELNATHTAALEAANKVNSGKQGEAFEGLKAQFETLNSNFTKSQEDNAALLLSNKTATVQTDLTTELSGVLDPYDKQNLTRDAMALLDPSTGQFKLSTGAMGSIQDVVSELKTLHPARFGSNQPKGAGINGGPTNALPANATDEQKRIASINAKFGK